MSINLKASGNKTSLDADFVRSYSKLLVPVIDRMLSLTLAAEAHFHAAFS